MRHSNRVTLAVLTIIVLFCATGLLAQVRQEVRIPDIMGYKTLKCDLHMHTVFSDGNVWPTVRVEEAWREGLDVISITDHIEYQPHKDDVATNFGRSYEIAAPVARERGILLIRGAEITRDTPPGHFNALFLSDINPLNTKELLDCMAEAEKQGAFIWWNHPDWQPQHIGWFDIHTTLYEKKYMRGIEVVNGDDYSASVHKWALDKNLTFMGNTDIHSPSLLERSTAEKHRPMTLVFAQSKTQEAVKDALENGRTAVWFENQIIGRQEYLTSLVEAMVKIGDIDRQGKVARFTIRNDSDLPLELVRTGDVGPKEFTLPANAIVRMKINAESEEKPVELEYTVKNFVIAPGKGLPVNLAVAGQLTFDIGAEISSN